MTSCEHCTAVRTAQADITWGQAPMLPTMTYPNKYWSPPDSPGRFDTDPGPCPCPCHDPWRWMQRPYGAP